MVFSSELHQGAHCEVPLRPTLFACLPLPALSPTWRYCHAAVGVCKQIHAESREPCASAIGLLSGCVAVTDQTERYHRRDITWPPICAHVARLSVDSLRHLSTNSLALSPLLPQLSNLFMRFFLFWFFLYRRAPPTEATSWRASCFPSGPRRSFTGAR